MVIDKEIAVYSIRNIKHSTSRSIFTIVSIFVGITTIFIFISFGLGLVAYTEKLKSESTVDKINIQPKGFGPPGLDDTFALTEEDLEAVDKTSGVIESTGVYFKPAQVKKEDSLKFVWVVAYDPKKPLVMEMFGNKPYEGRELRSGDSGKIVLGYNYLIENKIFDKRVELNDKIKVQERDFKVVGFYEAVGNPQDDSNVYMTEEDFKDIYGEEVKGFNWIIAKVDLEDIEKIIEKVERAVRKSRDLEEGKEDFFVQSFEDLLKKFDGVLVFVTIFIIAIALVSVLVSAINTANTMVTTTLERVKEIGIMKSVGARNSDIFKIFLFESGFLGFIAGVIGVLVGIIIVHLAELFLNSIGYGFLSPDYSFPVIIGLILFAIITGALSGVWPAWNASKIKPVEALRYE